MKTKHLVLSLVCLISCACSSSNEVGATEITDLIGRKVSVKKGSYKRVVCVGAGALRLYSYVGDMSLLCGVEDIDNTSLENRPKMFDGSPMPYLLANEDLLKTLPSCGVGGPNAQSAEPTKILECNPDIIVSFYQDKEKEDKLQKDVGVPVITLSLNDKKGVFSDEALASISLLGEVFNKQERAKELTDYIKAEEVAIKEATKNLTSTKKAYICGLGKWGTTNHLMTAQNYYPFNLAGIDNVINDLLMDGIQEIDEEKFVHLSENMDVVIFDTAAIKNVKGKGIDFSSVKAFQDGEVYLQMPYNCYYTNLETAIINSWYGAKAYYGDSLILDIEAKANEVTTKFNGKALYDKIKACKNSFGGYQKVENPMEFFN